jgi:hypothetical protein
MAFGCRAQLFSEKEYKLLHELLSQALPAQIEVVELPHSGQSTFLASLHPDTF